jgi:hypothetical protein
MIINYYVTFTKESTASNEELFTVAPCLEDEELCKKHPIPVTYYYSGSHMNMINPM